MLRESIESLFEKPPDRYGDEHARLFHEFIEALNSGAVRAAEPDAAAAAGWRVRRCIRAQVTLSSSPAIPKNSPVLSNVI